MRIRRFNENSDEFNILEDVAQEYIDKYCLTEFDLWEADVDLCGGAYGIVNHQGEDMIIIHAIKDKVNEKEFYQDMHKMASRLKSMGWENTTSEYNSWSAFIFSLTLKTRDDIWKSLWND